MKKKVENYLSEIAQFTTNDANLLNEFRIKYLSKKGIVNQLFASMREVEGKDKKEMGQLFNDVKVNATKKVEDLQRAIKMHERSQIEKPDLSLPANFQDIGSRHPLSIVRNEILDIFKRLGFAVSEGPEIEDDWHVFGALNFPPEHPARDMQDTFFVEKDPDVVLRTHTSSVQVRVMAKQEPPIRVVLPGRVYRNEDISARSHCFFHQIEGLYIDENVSFADLKQTLFHFATEFFGADTKIRFRPNYFPFTEPSAEMDISCNICGGEGCNVCKYTGWVEILGCGMVDPNVLELNNIDNEQYTGFAFGMGVERITMLKYKINDLRLFSTNDLRFLKQFEGVI